MNFIWVADYCFSLLFLFDADLFSCIESLSCSVEGSHILLHVFPRAHWEKIAMELFFVPFLFVSSMHLAWLCAC